MRWYKLAATQGDADAQLKLGFRYGKGQGVVRDYAEAVRWYKLAATKSHAGAQYNLGTMYYNGQGVVQDDIRAHMWFSLGALTDKDSGVSRDIVAKLMTPQQITQAQKLARECQARNFKNCD